MELWTQTEESWSIADLGSIFGNGRLFDIFLSMGMTSARDTADTEPHRLLVFSSEECRLLGMWGEAFFSREPAFFQLDSIVAVTIHNIGNFSRRQVSNVFPWADIVDYDEVDPGSLARKYVPQVLFLSNGVFTLTPSNTEGNFVLAVDISGRFASELAVEASGSGNRRNLN